MGNSQQKIDNTKYQYYSSQMHPIESQTDIFQIKDSGTYVMRKISLHTDQIVSLANQISKQNCPFLITYFGYEIPTFSLVCTQIIKTISVRTYWEYLNYDLEKDMCMNKMIQKPQNRLWQILTACINSAQVLLQHNIYLDFNMHNILFTTQKKIKIYWGNIEGNNVHRNYYKYFIEDKFIHGFYSPEELHSIKQNVFNKKLNSEKSSIYSLGVLILMYIQNQAIEHYYNFDNYHINKENVWNSFKNNYQKYSQKFMYILKLMLEQDNMKRICYKDMFGIIQDKINDKQNWQTEHSDTLSKRGKVTHAKVSLKL